MRNGDGAPRTNGLLDTGSTTHQDSLTGFDESRPGQRRGHHVTVGRDTHSRQRALLIGHRGRRIVGDEQNPVTPGP